MRKIRLLLIGMVIFGCASLVFAAGFAPELETQLALGRKAGEIKPAELKALIEKDAKMVILDAREAEQRSEGEIVSSPSGENVAITRGNLEFEVAKKIKDKNTLVVTYCRSGPRGILAAESLRKMGYKNIKSLEGGLKGWIEQGYPVETGAGTMFLKKD